MVESVRRSTRGGRPVRGRTGHRRRPGRGLARASRPPGIPHPSPTARRTPGSAARKRCSARATATSPRRPSTTRTASPPGSAPPTSSPSPRTSPAAVACAPPGRPTTNPTTPSTSPPANARCSRSSPTGSPTARSAPASSSATAPSNGTSPASWPSSTPPAAASSPPSPTASISSPTDPHRPTHRWLRCEARERLSLETPVTEGRAARYVGRACRGLSPRVPRFDFLGYVVARRCGRRTTCGCFLGSRSARVDRCGRCPKISRNSCPHPCRTRGFRALSVGGRCLDSSMAADAIELDTASAVLAAARAVAARSRTGKRPGC